MKHLLTTIIAQILLTVGMLPTIAFAQCSDSDGLNSFQKGQSEFRSGNSISRASDMCSADGKYVWEYYCPTSSGNWSAKQLVCTGGCKDGACVLAPQCIDSDPQNDPTLIGSLTFEEGTKKKSLGKDFCTNLGRELTQVSCSTSSGASITTTKSPCRTGCLDGRCIPATERLDGCYFSIKTKLVKNTKTYLLTQATVAPTIGQFYTRMMPTKSSTTPSKYDISIKTLSSSGTVIKEYSHTPTFFVSLESISNKQFTGKHRLLPIISNDFIIPFDTEVSRIVVSFNGKQIPLTLSLAQKSCIRSCITPLESGQYARGDICCMGTPERVNEILFVCPALPASPSPSASATPRTK